MKISTKRLLAVGALAGATVLGVGAPAMAATHSHRHAVRHAAPAAAPTTATTTQVGTAVQYVRDADGTVHEVPLP